MGTSRDDFMGPSLSGADTAALPDHRRAQSSGAPSRAGSVSTQKTRARRALPSLLSLHRGRGRRAGPADCGAGFLAVMVELASGA